MKLEYHVLIPILSLKSPNMTKTCREYRAKFCPTREFEALKLHDTERRDILVLH